MLSEETFDLEPYMFQFAASMEQQFLDRLFAHWDDKCSPRQISLLYYRHRQLDVAVAYHLEMVLAMLEIRVHRC